LQSLVRHEHLGWHPLRLLDNLLLLLLLLDLPLPLVLLLLLLIIESVLAAVRVVRRLRAIR
jgi:phosphatidylglycerophosphate synthase